MAYLKTVPIGQRPSLSDLQTNHNYTNIAGAATTDIKDGPGRLHKIIINGGTAGDITIYDENSTGTTTKIGTITEEMIYLASNYAVSVFPYDCDFKEGLRITTEKATDITVIWT
jgi:hypothetical protein